MFALLREPPQLMTQVLIDDIGHTVARALAFDPQRCPVQRNVLDTKCA